MSTYTNESSDIPTVFILRPVYNGAQAVTAANANISFQNRVINSGDATDVIYKDTRSATFDMLGASYASKTVTVAGLGSITYAQIASAIKKMADAERLLLP